MEATPILPPVAAWIRVAELADLSLEIFATTYGAGWPEADRLAAEQLPELLDYAAEWDCAALAAGNAAAECSF